MVSSYGVQTWVRNYSTKPVFWKQKKIILIIHNAKYNAHTNISFKHSKILKLSEMVEMEILKVVYLFTKNELPLPLMKVFSCNVIQQYINSGVETSYKELQC